MSHTIEKLAGEPIIVVTYNADYDLAVEGTGTLDGMAALLDAQTEPVYMIYNVRELKLDLDDLMAGTNLVARGDRAVLKHPAIRESILITTSEFFRLAAKGVSNPVFGSVAVKVFGTLADGIAYCHQS